MKLLAALLPLGLAACSSFPQVHVARTDDFDVTGSGDAAPWRSVAWTPMRRRQVDGHPYETRFKMLYSKTGLYILMDGTDRKLTTTGRKDDSNLWEEDVYEVFLQPDDGLPLYFEYEISPLGFELPILVSNNHGTFMGWLPWYYLNDRKIRKATAATGGPKQAGATVEGWTAEFFIPYLLFKGINGVPPGPGTRWRANLYRMDYDDGHKTQWDWSPVGESFHEYRGFGVLLFD
ncbi:MAG TPA: carbohydrate-binding family 9-like protein [Planctomycetota bacterium]|nr:carbohydrate-binding family 9-like protein [Planctomycetota bacterium]